MGMLSIVLGVHFACGAGALGPDPPLVATHPEAGKHRHSS